MSSIEWHGIERMRSGPLFGIAANVSLRVRRRCYEWLRERAGGFSGKVVLDHGSTPDTSARDSNCHLPWLLADGALVYATSAENIDALERVYPGVHVVAWPASAHFARRADLVISSSVIAHVGARDAQRAYVEELFALGERVYLTTPNREHWLEFHTKLPLLHWLPDERYRAILRRFGLSYWTHLNLLDRGALEGLVTEAAANRGLRVTTEWFAPRLLGRVSNLVVLATAHRP